MIQRTNRRGTDREPDGAAVGTAGGFREINEGLFSDSAFEQAAEDTIRFDAENLKRAPLRVRRSAVRYAPLWSSSPISAASDRI